MKIGNIKRFLSVNSCVGNHIASGLYTNTQTWDSASNNYFSIYGISGLLPITLGANSHFIYPELGAGILFSKRLNLRYREGYQSVLETN